jgi:DNA helicase-2/ATP-dependent DNA helicase PcrA
MNTPIDFAQELDDTQWAAVRHAGGPLLVHAGPGTGKTRVLTYRIAYLVSVRGVKPEGILAVTFTNQAAREVAERAAKLVPEVASRNGTSCATPHPTISTFHSWALAFLRETLGDQARTPIDGEEARELCMDAAREAGLGTKGRGRLYAAVSQAKQHYPPRPDRHPELAGLYQAYEGLLERHGLWDYDDLLLEALKILDEPAAREVFRGRIPYLLIDEFQDVSPVQYALVRAMAAKDAEVTVIGDPNQAIYGFRGASPSYVRRFREEFTAVTTVTLERAYRCPQTILDAASSVIEHGVPRLVSARGKGARVTVRSFESPDSEAAWVARTIEKRVGGLSFDSINSGAAQGHVLRSLSDVAVIFRANALGDPVAAALSGRGIPFQRADSPDPLAEKDLRAVWRMWEAAKGRHPHYHLTRLGSGGKRRKERLQDLLPGLEGKDGPGLLESIIQALGLDPSSARIRALKNAIERHPHADSLALLFREEADLLDCGIEAVSLLSVHAAKGLEFPIVFLVGCEQGILPWREADVEEEGRLFYVGLTRASDSLYISYARRRRLFGRQPAGGPSPFLARIPEDTLARETESRPKKTRKPRQRSLF